MDIPKPADWKSVIRVLGRDLTFDQSWSNDGPGEGFAWWHDEADEVELKYHYASIAPDFAGERIEIWDYRDGVQQWVYQRARVGWQLNPSGLPPELLGQEPSWDVGPEQYPTVQSTANEKFAEEMRDAVKAFMEADPYYFDVPIVTERLQDLDAKIDETIQLSGGILVVLVVVTFDDPLPNLPGANFASIKLVARVIENLNLNATGKGAQEIAIHTAALWSQLKPDALSSPLKLEGVELGNDPRGLTYDATATTEGGTKIEIPRLGDVTIDASDLDAIALAHETPGVAIFYTLNNTPAVPRNPAANVFVAPFNSAPGVTVRARAWLAGYIPSAEKKQTL